MRLAEARRGSRGTGRSGPAAPGPGASAARRRRPRGSAPRSSRTGAVSTGRAPAYSSSRRIRRGIVSPSIRSMTNPSPRSSAGSSRNRTVGTGTPAAAAACSSRYSVERSDWPRFEPGSRRSTSPWRSPSSTASNDQLSRDAPPESRRSPSTSIGTPRNDRRGAAGARRSVGIDDAAPHGATLAVTQRSRGTARRSSRDRGPAVDCGVPKRRRRRRRRSGPGTRRGRTRSGRPSVHSVMPSEMRVTSCSPSGVARRLRNGIMLSTLPVIS